MLETLSAPVELYQVQASPARTIKESASRFVELISTAAERASFIGFLFNQLGNIAEAEDVFQDTCAHFLEGGASYIFDHGLPDDYPTFQKLFWGYLNAQKYRYRGKSKLNVWIDFSTDDGLTIAETIPEAWDQSQRAHWLEPRRLRLAVLDRARFLSPQYFEVIKWVVLCGVPTEKYARRIGKTEKQIKTLAERAKFLLAEDAELVRLVRIRKHVDLAAQELGDPEQNLEPMSALEQQIVQIRTRRPRGRPCNLQPLELSAGERNSKLRSMINGLRKNLVAVPSHTVVDRHAIVW